jgi:hypothetical protein
MGRLSPRPQLILPYLDLEIRYYDLGLPNRCAEGPKEGGTSCSAGRCRALAHWSHTAPRLRCRTSRR